MRFLPDVEVGDIEAEARVPERHLGDPEGGVLAGLREPEAPQPRLDARQAVRVQRLRLLRQPLQPLCVRRQRRRSHDPRPSPRPAPRAGRRGGDPARTSRGEGRGDQGQGTERAREGHGHGRRRLLCWTCSSYLTLSYLLGCKLQASWFVAQELNS